MKFSPPALSASPQTSINFCACCSLVMAGEDSSLATPDYKLTSDTLNIIVNERYFTDPTKAPNWPKKLAETAMSYRSMANMRKVAPKMAEIKERYGDNREKLGQEMMKLYKTEKINPLSGCLPILVQMPVFIALYWVLMESVELRQAPFFLWIEDLSIKDPLFILPLLMGASMFIQFKLNPTPPDPMQARVMQLMPVIFTVFFLWFPAGLVLYWVVNNVLSIAQQYVITKQIEKS